MRYPMNIAQDPVSSVALPVFNITSTTAYVELTASALIVKEGSLFEETFDLSNLGRAELIPWEWYMGIGLHTDFQSTVAPITSMEKVIAIRLNEAKPTFLPLAGPLGFQVPCKRLIFSLRDADTFLTNFNAGRVDPDQGPKTVTIE